MLSSNAVILASSDVAMENTITGIITISRMICYKFMIAVDVMIGAIVMTDVLMRYRLGDEMAGSQGDGVDQRDSERAARPCAVLLSRLAKQVYRRNNEEQVGMQLRHLMSLSYVSDHDGCPQQDLADAFCMDANNVVLLLNELEQLGYATRQRDPSDRRRHLVHITPAGREALIATVPGQLAIEDEVLAALDPDERRTLCDLLTRALRNVEPDEPREAPDYSATVASIST
jgi:DNA-binding MarR family transcriptional regulator